MDVVRVSDSINHALARNKDLMQEVSLCKVGLRTEKSRSLREATLLTTDRQK